MGVMLSLDGKTFDSGELEARGIFIPGLQGFIEPGVKHNFKMAQDSQPTLITTSNAGIPAYMTNYVDPKVIEILVTPMKAAEIVGGEIRKGNWTTTTEQFSIVESVGEVSSYGDFNENGTIGTNINWVYRDSYLFQTFTQWGELELERAGEARIDHAARLQISSALALNKFQNKSYFFGISGLRNYGLLNDPSLFSPISPAAGTWATLDAAAIYTDIQRLYKQLIVQTKGLIEASTPMTLALSPTAETNLTKTNIYNVNVYDQLKKNFPNMRIISAVEYATDSGELVQLIANAIDGQETAEVAFNEKMRAHPVVVGASNYKQKKTGGTWGCVIKQPTAIAQLLGV